ncbi:hypothetical protein [Terrisporobacter hibernicus]|uniref:Flagellar basal body protein n=1 Tax=Terrisporobacter hibernicus TaxID=2813371 RepID=A0AAX2ZGL3_9FIRM|nr:hypothetical protein [Terrisporobacter hibernicus]UEL48201.1 hypothetical protein JW646_01755 [Terrisporobacter hibernicus]
MDKKKLSKIILVITTAITLFMSIDLMNNYLKEVSKRLNTLIVYKSKPIKESMYDLEDDMISKIDIKSDIKMVSEDYFQTKDGDTFYSKRYDDTIVEHGAEYGTLYNMKGNIYIKNNLKNKLNGAVSLESKGTTRFYINPSSSEKFPVDMNTESDKPLLLLHINIDNNSIIESNGVSYGKAEISYHMPLDCSEVLDTSMDISPTSVNLTEQEIIDCFIFNNKNENLTNLLTNLVSKNSNLFNRLVNETFSYWNDISNDISISDKD